MSVLAFMPVESTANALPAYSWTNHGQFANELDQADTSFYVGERRRAMLTALHEVRAGAFEPGWDGYGAQPVSADTARKATSFLLSLPEWVPLPELSAHADGEIGLDWWMGQTRVLTSSIAADGVLKFAFRVGRDRQTGRMVMADHVPSGLLVLLRQLVAGTR